MFDHKVYFDSVRESLFGPMTDQQVEGQEAILSGWEEYLWGQDMRFLSYMLASAMHETASKMWPIPEINGASQPYGQPDEDGKCWYGRGLIQLTHKGNYERANRELGIEGTPDDCVVDPDKQLDPHIAARTMWFGMSQGWFRSDSKGPHTLSRYFGQSCDDPFNARNILNGDRNTVPDWSDGVSIGKLVEGYHDLFLAALEAAYRDVPVPEPEPEPEVAEVLVEWTTSPDERSP
jgi:Chitinase class I